MARLSDPKKAALWQRRFRRFLDSGLSVARFCTAEHVSESSFYYWQKKLGPPRRGRAVVAEHRAAGCGGRSTITDEQRMFRPVTVVRAACGVVVQLPGGARIEVDAAHLDAIRAVVAETLRGAQDRTTEHDALADSPLLHKHGGAVSC